MTTNKNFTERNRDAQDNNERHVYSKMRYLKEGALVTVNGTGTTDQEAVVINTGYGMQYKADENSEVILLSLGSDRSQKFAMIAIPRNKQRQWKEEAGGVQSPVDPTKALEFNPKRTWATEENFAVGQGLFEIKDGEVYFRVPVHFGNDVTVAGKVQAGGNVETAAAFRGPEPSGSGPVPPAIPGFEE